MRNDVKGTLKTSFLAIKLNWQLLCCVFSVNRNEEKKYTKHADDTTLMAESEELESLDESERGERKVDLKLNIQKTKIMVSDPVTSWQIDGETWKQWETLFFWAPKSLQMVTAVMKLKDAYSLEEKLWPTWTAY